MNRNTSTAEWTALYNTGIGPELDLEYLSPFSAFQLSAIKQPDKVAINFFNSTLTYEDIDTQSDALACALEDTPVRPGDRISIITQNTPTFLLAVLAAWKLGAIPVPGNPAYKRKELSAIFSNSMPSAVICETQTEEEVRSALESADLSSIPVYVASNTECPPPEYLARDNTVENQIELQKGQKPNLYDTSPEDTGLILYTSGTTGEPKGAVISHRSLSFSSQFYRDWCNLSQKSNIYCMAPFFHITGFLGHLGAALISNCTMTMHYRFEPKLAVQMIKKWKPTYTVGAITAFNAIMSVPGVKKDDMGSFKQVYSGGAPIAPALKKEIESKLGFTIYSAYGMTESTSPAVFAPFGIDSPLKGEHLALGIPIPSTSIKIADDEGNELPRGSEGEILIKGPQVMKEYWRKPKETSATIVDGWLKSGDVGIMDDKGWIYLVDRKKDVIIASGFKVWPREVEDVLYSHPSIREAAVIGVPDDYRGENVKACISFREGMKISEEDIIAHCRSNLTGYKVPRIIDILDDLPKTATGKIMRVALRENAAHRASC